MFTLQKSFRFEASHQLMYHEGKCRRLHGHSWVLIIEVNGFYINENKDNNHNMLMDFGYISKIVKPLVESKLDHYHLNDTLNSESPTSEFICKWIYEYLKKELQYLSAVTIENSRVEKKA